MRDACPRRVLRKDHITLTTNQVFIERAGH